VFAARPPRCLALPLLALVVLVGLSGCAVAPSAGGSPSPASTAIPDEDLPVCVPPPKVPTPSWFPADLPLPPGSYFTRDLTPAAPYHRGLFAAPGSVEAFGRFVLSRWPSEGWLLGRGDAEFGEVENQFVRGSAAGGFRARDAFCKPGYVNVLIIYDPGADGS
jgi:hypothetical protein